ncbi:SDR family oxidoreductase [Caballeronia sp. GAFFF1]|uniref:SDR family oxidoreductase n=1 Tax=Caballeronia sp. GAFFF1 TaxID=2921779 RepID=UPI0020278617|nr:SDR family oxidoreductase [Caballeronia sp. GAFFF1]
MTLKDKRVVVLGGTSGIGFAIAKAVAESGGTPVVVSRKPESVESAIGRLPSGAEGHTADVTSETEVAALFEKIGEIDHIAYTAADNVVTGPLSDMDLGVARDFLGARFWGPLTVAKYGARHIRPGGSIVLTSGIAGARPPGPGWAMGAAVCSAIDGLARALAIELAPIRVNAVAPGWTRTPVWRAIPEDAREALFAEVGAKLPVGRVALPEEIAASYLFLMESPYTTGHTVVSDGGSLLV